MLQPEHFLTAVFIIYGVLGVCISASIIVESNEMTPRVFFSVLMTVLLFCSFVMAEGLFVSGIDDLIRLRTG